MAPRNPSVYDDGDVRNRLTFMQFATIYIASLALGMIVAFGGEALTGFDSMRILFGYFSVAFLLAAMNRPWWWSAALRTTGWFSLLPNAPLTWIFVAVALLSLWLAFTTKGWPQ